MSRILRTAGNRVLLPALLLLIPIAAPVRAEIGVVIDLPSGAVASGPYVYTIIDDSDPINGIWYPVSPPGGARVALNPLGDDNGDGRPSILRHLPSGLPLVAWSRNSAGGYDVVVSRFENGAWGDPQVVAGSGADELDPFLIPGPGGEVHLLYWLDDGASSAVYHSQAPADLSSWSVPVRVSEQDQSARRPVGAFDEGVLRVAYEVDEGPAEPTSVALARRDGQNFLVEVLATSYNSGPLQPEAHSHSGRFWVDWMDASGIDDYHGDMAWLRRNDLGNWEVVRYEPFGGQEARDYHVRGAIRHQALTLP